jgi:predicted nucleic acid-binding protein
LSLEAIGGLLEREALGRLSVLVAPVAREAYADLVPETRRRLSRRDESSWPFVALALRLNCPAWTEDQDFFGSGVANWTIDRIELCLGLGP